jgi:Holliday junction DNA helicase RuvA
MIGYIKGIVSGFPKDACFLETGGIGYRIFISERTRSLLHIGEEARLLTYMAVREDAILLYGFPEQDEYDLFLILISVSKIGPKVAIGILSSMTPDAFVRAIVSRNVTALTKLPGIGKKTAERLVVELKDKVANLEMEGVSMDGEDIAAADSGLIGQASLALSGLGYSSEEVLPLLKKLAPDHPVLSDLIGAVLREFGKAQG